jgi:hypothetical protein
MCFPSTCVGPADQQSLSVKVDGNVRSLSELIHASIGSDQAVEVKSAFDEIAEKKIMKNRMPSRFIPGGQQQLVFRWAKTPENAQYWDLLKASQEKWDIEYCYCSVFHECWQVLKKRTVPVPVKECRRDEGREFMPQRNAARRLELKRPEPGRTPDLTSYRAARVVG